MKVLIDLDLGNINSVRNMAARIGHTLTVAKDPRGCEEGTLFILPGVGSFDTGMRRLHETGWGDFISQADSETRILGICLGMQLLGASSEEGTAEGLGRVPAHFRRFPQGLATPHMGWNTVESEDRLFAPEMGEHRFYFTHSYFAESGPYDVVGETVYGRRFVSAYRNGATVGVQFHPEKSHKFGMSFLRAWLEG